MKGSHGALFFTATAELRDQVQQALGPEGLSHYLKDVAVFAAILGETELARQSIQASAKLAAGNDAQRGLSPTRLNEALILFELGRLDEAEALLKVYLGPRSSSRIPTT